jgi:hypothetical protein
MVIVLLVAGSHGFGALLDVWRASDLEVLAEGDAVGSWTSLSNRSAVASVGNQPIIHKNATPAGSPVVRFNQNRLVSTANPVSGRSAFSLVVVFKAAEAGIREEANWFGKSGIVDASQPGIANDWGLSIRESGVVCFGTGNPDSTVYLDSAPFPSVVDDQYHIAVCSWGEGRQTMYLDGYGGRSRTSVSTTRRDTEGSLSFGAINTGEINRRFVGDLAEVRFYDNVLNAGEAAAVIQELTGQYLIDRRPAILSFTSNPPGQVHVGTPVDLLWQITNASAVFIDNDIGWVSAGIGSVRVQPYFTTTYQLMASNSFGIRFAEVNVQVDPGIPIAMAQSVITFRDKPVSVKLAGQDPNGDALTFHIVTPPRQGTLTGIPPDLVYTPDVNSSGEDHFTFKVNDGFYDSPTELVTIQIEKEPSLPSAVLLSTKKINAEANPGTFLAALRTLDANLEDVHTYALVPGLGDSDNHRFAIVGRHLVAGAEFPVLAGSRFLIRIRTTDATGLILEQSFQLTAEAPLRQIVINEIHYNPPENTRPEEFIELYNPSLDTINLTGWRLRGGIDYSFGNVTIAPQGYLVVARDPVTIRARYGIEAVGPWVGNLSSEGERLVLRAANDEIIDEVDYRSEFPWPIAANGSGPSMELLHPELDNDLGGSWKSPLDVSQPSPGLKNRVFTENPPPQLRQVEHSPMQPHSTNGIIVTAKVTDPHGVAAVRLDYQVVTPGAFLPAYIVPTPAQLDKDPHAIPPLNPAFEAATNWVRIRMRDDGQDGDTQAGDDVYTGVMSAQANRTLVRYRIVAEDTLGADRRAPFEDDASLNFACFVYDGIPSYEGVSAQALESLPVYFLITRAIDYEQCTAYTNSALVSQGGWQLDQFKGSIANEARYVFNWPGAFVCDGVVYDHIRYRLRGANGRYQPGKRSFRIGFNDGHFLAAKDEMGRPYPRKWSSLNTAKGQSNRQTLNYSLNEALNYHLFNTVGVPAPGSHFFHWRIVRGPQEAPDRYNGDFYGLSWAQENYDARFLEAHDLPKGNLYKLINAQRDSDPYRDMVKQRRYQGLNAVTNGSDGVRIQNRLLNPNATMTDAWMLANVNYAQWYRYHGICEAIRNYDFWPSANKNCAWLFDTNYNATNEYCGRLWTLPWDTTDSWGPSWNSGQDLAWNGLFGGSTANLHTNMHRDYRNTLREIRDLLFQPDQIRPLIEAYAARIAAVVPADLARWSNAVPSSSAYRSLSSPGPGLTQGLPGLVKDMTNFAFVGGSWPGGSVPKGGHVVRLDAVSADAGVPSRPSIAYVGPAGYPMDALTFDCTAFSDPQGAQTFGALRWRLAEVQDPDRPSIDRRIFPPLEWNVIWDSGPLTQWNSRITVPGAYVTTNRLFRVRVAHRDATGRWSHWSNPHEFRVTAVDLTQVLRQSLVISEIMYHPPAWGGYSGDDLEFLELRNISDQALDLSGLMFTDGITYVFTQGTRLGGGQSWLLVRNRIALQARYPEVAVDGVYDGKLDNGSEALTLSLPSGAILLRVTYEDQSPWPVTADGLGWSLVLEDSVNIRYRASTHPGGSPGANDPPCPVPVLYLNELVTASDAPQLDAIEIYNPNPVAVDMGNWFLSDDAGNPWKIRTPANTLIPAGGYLVLDESDFNQGTNGFALSSSGERVFLFSGDGSTNLTGYVHEANLGAARDHLSFGRYTNSVGEEEFASLSSLTLGATNARPLLGPVVVSEIMFHPPSTPIPEASDLEYIELRNASPFPVALFDPANPSQTWGIRNAVEFDFTYPVTLEAGGCLLIVGFDPQISSPARTAFLAAYGGDTNSLLVGPWKGHLDNQRDRIELVAPGWPRDDGNIPKVVMERVSYDAMGSHPGGQARGNGHSLQRTTLLAYGNEPTNWFAALPTIGTLDPRTSSDADGDGLPDEWELRWGTDPFVPDAQEDLDQDGVTNYAEWRAGTQPLDPASRFQIDQVQLMNGLVTLQFLAISNRAYRLEGTPSLQVAPWTILRELPPASVTQPASISLSNSPFTFFRLVIPAAFSHDPAPAGPSASHPIP